MMLSSGTRLGPYEIIAPLGAGATSEVYRARDSRLNRDVALKLLGNGNPTAATKRFDQEAKAAAALNHPNVLSILDIGTEGERPYLVYELLDGRTMRELLDRGRISLSDAVRFGLQIARGLAAVHDKGVVHRDLKPENLFVTSEGGLKILDFGLARLRELRPAGQASSASDTRPGYILGSLGYLPPEQILGNPVDQRADLFSLGAVLYEMICGRRAFRGNSERQVLEAIIAHEPEALSTLVPSIPHRLQRIVERCLQKEPEDRVGSAIEVAHQLELVLEQLEGPETLVRVPARPARILAASILVAAIAGAVFLLRSRGPRGGEQGPPPVRPAYLAVLPLTNLDGGDNGDAFSAGLVEVLTNRLSQVEELQSFFRVISARDVQKERAMTPSEAASLFGATMALSGTVRKTAGATIVTLALSDTRSHLVLHSRDAILRDGERQPLDALLVENVADMLGARIGPTSRKALTEGQTPAPAAYDFYLQGLGYLRRYDRAESLASAIELFTRALARDPRYALAHAGIAEAELRRYQYSRDTAHLERARSSGQKAMAADAQLPEVHRTLALVEASAGTWEKAVESLEQSLKLQPRDPDALRELGHAQDKLGKKVDAESTFRRAVAMQPGSWAAYSDLGEFYNAHGRLEEAANAFRHVIELTPDNYVGYWSLGGIYGRMERWEDADKALRRSLELKPTAQAWFNLATLQYRRKLYDRAAETYRKAVELNPKDERTWGSLGDALRWAKKQDEAARAYRRAVSLIDERIQTAGATPQLLSLRAMYLVSMGDRDSSLRDIARAVEGAPHDAYVLYRAGLVFEQCSKRERALDALASAAKAGYPAREMRRSPPLEDLVRDPRFKSVEGVQP